MKLTEERKEEVLALCKKLIDNPNIVCYHTKVLTAEDSRCRKA